MYMCICIGVCVYVYIHMGACVYTYIYMGVCGMNIYSTQTVRERGAALSRHTYIYIHIHGFV